MEATPEELRLLIAAIAGHILPELEAEFGVRSRDLRIVLDPIPSPDDLGGHSGSRGITLYPMAVPHPHLMGVLAHEIVHWLVHWHDSYWNTLPIVVEEGLAHLKYHVYSSFEVPPNRPSNDDLARLLWLSHEEYKESGESKLGTYAGIYIVQQLGLEGIRELAQRAHRAKHETVPAGWVMDALAKVEAARLLEVPVPAP